MANTLKALGHGDCYGILIGETDGKKKVYPDYINQESYDIFKTFYINVFPKKKKVPELKRFTFEKDATPEIIKYKFTAKQLEDINAVNAFLNGMSFDLIKIEKVENILTDRQIQGQPHPGDHPHPRTGRDARPRPERAALGGGTRRRQQYPVSL